MTTFTYHDVRWDIQYIVYHDREDFIGAEATVAGSGSPVRTFTSLSELPLPVRQKVESILCQTTIQ